MATQTRRPQIAALDDRAEGAATLTGGDSIDSVVDANSLQKDIERASKRNREGTRPYRQYQKRVIELAEVPNTHQTRQMTSHICGAVARLSFVPDDSVQIKDERGEDTTEFEQQIIRTAAFAETQLGSEMVWTVSARKLARAALELRKQDPDGSKGVAWVNDTREDEASVLDD